MYVTIVKLSFMNDFSKEAASNLLVQIGKTKGFAEGMLLRMSVDVSNTQRYSMTVWPNKKMKKKHGKYLVKRF